MRLRKLALAVGLAGAMGANLASALGLGEIKLNSSLNQPLDAEIKLLQTRELTEGEIYVALASKEDFQNAGVERDFFLNDMKFKVILDGASGPVVRVTTKKPVREPYLNFLLQTQWPSGRILREYTLLMDLPVFSQETAKPAVRRAAAAPPAEPAPRRAAPPVRESVRQSAEPVAQAEEPKAVEVERPKPEPKRSSSYSADSYGPVKANDTLWEIALKVRPDRSYSVHKTMLAIQRLNPEAFIKGNINLLRKGQVLRIPDAGEIDTMGSREAINQVAEQNNEWSSGKTMAGPQLDASRSYASSRPSSDKVEGRLTLAASSPSERVSAGKGSGAAADGDSEALQNELAISLEELDKSNRENRELKERIGELEDQIETMERLIEVSNQELRALQLASRQSGGAVSDEVVENNVVDKTMPAVDDAIDSGSVAVEAPDEPMVEPQQADAPDQLAANTNKPDPSKSVSSVVTSPAPKPSLMDTLMENIALVGGGAAALLLGLLMLLRRRQKDEEETSLDAYEPEMTSDPDEPQQAPLDSLEVDADEVEADLEEQIDEQLDELDLEDDFSSESETGDAVAEADIYIAYGKFDQAEEMLLKAIGDDSDSAEARLKLLEVYAESGQLQKFDGQYAQVLQLNDAGAAERAAELRGHFADAPDFDPESATEETAGSGSLDFDLEAPSEVDAEASAAEAEDEFDFDLTDELQGDSIEQGGDGLVDLDFDLDLDDDNEVASSDQTADEALDFDLDLDDSDSEAESANEFSEEFALDVESLDVDDGDAIDLDLDSGLDMPESDDGGIEFDLGEAEGEGVAAEESDVDAESLTAESGVSEDHVSDELTSEGDEEGFQSFDLEGDTLEPDVPEDTEASDFDLTAELDSDVDLASLDEEMDALSAGLEAEAEVEGLSVDSDGSDDDLADFDFEAGVSQTDSDDSLEEGLDLTDEFASELGDELNLQEGSESQEALLAAEDIQLDGEELSLEGEDFSLAEAAELDEEVLQASDDSAEVTLDLEGEAAELDADFDLELAAEGLDMGSTEESADTDLNLEDQLDLESDLNLEGDLDSESASDLNVDSGSDSGLALDESAEAELESVDAELLDEGLDLDLSAEPESEEHSDLGDLELDLSEGLEPEALDTEALEAESLDSDSLGSESLSSESLSSESLELEASESEAAEVELSESAVPELEAQESDVQEAPSDDGVEGEDGVETEDDVFTQALSDLPSADDVDFSADDLDLAEGAPILGDDDLEAELDFLSDSDEVATKLDLARAYIDMGDQDGAKDILEEVVQEGNDDQKKEAEELLGRV